MHQLSCGVDYPVVPYWVDGTTTMKEDGDGAIARAFKVLEYMDHLQRPVGLTELVEQLDMPRSSAAALISTMVRLGYLSHDRSSRTYMPTARVAELGRWVDLQLLGRDQHAFIPLIAELRHRLDETVVLGTPNDLYVQYIHVDLAERPVLYYVKTGAQREMCRSAVGWSLLMSSTDAEIERLVRRHNASKDLAASPVDTRELIGRIKAARQGGYAFSKHTVMPGSGMVAMPVPRVAHSRPIAIGVGGPVERLEEKLPLVVAALRETVEQFSVVLHRPQSPEDEGDSELASSAMA